MVEDPAHDKTGQARRNLLPDVLPELKKLGVDADEGDRYFKDPLTEIQERVRKKVVPSGPHLVLAEPTTAEQGRLPTPVSTPVVAVRPDSFRSRVEGMSLGVLGVSAIAVLLTLVQGAFLWVAPAALVALTALSVLGINRLALVREHRE